MPILNCQSVSNMVRYAPFFLGLAIALTVGSLLGIDRFIASGHEESSDVGAVYRWRRVELTLPDSGVAYDVIRSVPFSPENDRFVIQVAPRTPQGYVPPRDAFPELWIDAETGEVLRDTLSAEYAAEAEALIDSVVVTDEPPRAWPYEGDPPQGRSVQLRNITYIEPEPGSGLLVSEQRGQCGEPGCKSSVTLIVEDGISQLRINARTGEADWSGTRSDPDGVFSRFAESVDVTAPTSGVEPE